MLDQTNHDSPFWLQALELFSPQLFRRDRRSAVEEFLGKWGAERLPHVVRLLPLLGDPYAAEDGASTAAAFPVVHVMGLSGMGKTSMVRELLQAIGAPTVFVDCSLVSGELEGSQMSRTRRAGMAADLLHGIASELRAALTEALCPDKPHGKKTKSDKRSKITHEIDAALGAAKPGGLSRGQALVDVVQDLVDAYNSTLIQNCADLKSQAPRVLYIVLDDVHRLIGSSPELVHTILRLPEFLQRSQQQADAQTLSSVCVILTSRTPLVGLADSALSGKSLAPQSAVIDSLPVSVASAHALCGRLAFRSQIVEPAAIWLPGYTPAECNGILQKQFWSIAVPALQGAFGVQWESIAQEVESRNRKDGNREALHSKLTDACGSKTEKPSDVNLNAAALLMRGSHNPQDTSIEQLQQLWCGFVGRKVSEVGNYFRADFRELVFLIRRLWVEHIALWMSYGLCGAAPSQSLTVDNAMNAHVKTALTHLGSHLQFDLLEPASALSTQSHFSSTFARTYFDKDHSYHSHHRGNSSLFSTANQLSHLLEGKRKKFSCELIDGQCQPTAANDESAAREYFGIRQDDSTNGKVNVESRSTSQRAKRRTRRRAGTEDACNEVQRGTTQTSSLSFAPAEFDLTPKAEHLELSRYSKLLILSAFVASVTPPADDRSRLCDKRASQRVAAAFSPAVADVNVRPQPSRASGKIKKRPQENKSSSKARKPAAKKAARNGASGTTQPKSAAMPRKPPATTRRRPRAGKEVASYCGGSIACKPRSPFTLDRWLALCDCLLAGSEENLEVNPAILREVASVVRVGMIRFLGGQQASTGQASAETRRGQTAAFANCADEREPSGSSSASASLLFGSFGSKSANSVQQLLGSGVLEGRARLLCEAPFELVEAISVAEGLPLTAVIPPRE